MKSLIAILAAVGFVPAIFTSAWAQDTSQPSSNPTAQQTLPGTGQASTTNNADTVLPDMRPVSGAEFLTLGTPERARNVVNADIAVDERADSNSSGTGTGTSWTADTDLYGNASLNRSWKRSSFSAQYAGGASFFGEGTPQSTQYLKLSQVFGWKRWALTLTDQLTYAPESPFGFAGPWSFSVGYIGTKPVLIPNQTVYTGEATRISNVSLGEVDYGLTKHSSLTAVASYGILDYFNDQAVNSNQLNGTLGYNYAITPHHKIAVSYGYEEIKFLDYANGQSKTEVQTSSINYAFQATGRLSFQIGGGAQLVKTFSTGVAPANNLYPYAQGVITYAWHRMELGLLGSQSIMSGGGLYPASRATLAQAGLSRMLSRKWEAAIIGGYARNSPLQAYLTTGSQLTHTAYAGATVRRSIGRHLGLFFLYNFQHQDVVTPFCTGSLCVQDFLRNSFGGGIDWRFSPWYFHVKE